MHGRINDKRVTERNCFFLLFYCKEKTKYNSDNLI